MRCATTVTVSIEGAARELLALTSGSTCAASEFIVVTDSEFQQFTASPFRLSVGEASVLSFLIIGVWVAGFAIRQLVRSVLSSPDTL